MQLKPQLFKNTNNKIILKIKLKFEFHILLSYLMLEKCCFLWSRMSEEKNKEMPRNLSCYLVIQFFSSKT